MDSINNVLRQKIESQTLYQKEKQKKRYWICTSCDSCRFSTCSRFAIKWERSIICDIEIIRYLSILTIFPMRAHHTNMYLLLQLLLLLLTSTSLRHFFGSNFTTAVLLEYVSSEVNGSVSPIVSRNE